MAPGLPCPALALGLLALLLPGTRSDCGLPPNLAHAIPPVAQMESYPVGTPVTYRCQEGFVKIPGKSDTAQCLQSSEWSPLQEFCGRSCGVPTRLKFAALSSEDERRSYYPVGIDVTYTCRPAYENITSEQLVSTCSENLAWSEVPELCRKEQTCSFGEPCVPCSMRNKGSTKTGEFSGKAVGKSYIKCKGKSCGPPGEILNGRAVQGTEFLFGDKIQFVCEEGYKFIGRSFIQCIVSGGKVEWSKLPTCQVITCSAPPDIANGTHDGKDVENPVYNTTVTYRCDPEFQLVGAPSIHCKTEDKINGNWSGPAPECKGKSCGPPGELPNGRAVQGTKYMFGDKIQFVCEEGYKLIGQSFIQCILKGDEVEWSERPTCQVMTCSDIPNGMHDGKGVKNPVSNTTEIYRCDPGFQLVGATSVHCKTEDKISRAQQTLESTCPWQVDFSRTPRSLAACACAIRGWRAVFASVCQALKISGIWTGPAPECKGDECRWAPLPRLRFVMPLYKDQNYCSVDNKGSSICQQSYMGISGVLPSATCFNNFPWSQVPSLCGKRSWLSRRTNAWQSCCYSRFPIRCKSVFHP